MNETFILNSIFQKLVLIIPLQPNSFVRIYFYVWIAIFVAHEEAHAGAQATQYKFAAFGLIKNKIKLFKWLTVHVNVKLRGTF